MQVPDADAAKVVKVPAPALTRTVQATGEGGMKGRSKGPWVAILLGVLVGAFFGLRSIFSDRPLQPVPAAVRDTGQAGVVPAGNVRSGGDGGADDVGHAEQYRRAVVFAQTNPAEYAEAIRRFRAVKRAAEGTDIAIKAEAEMQLLQDAFTKALAAAYSSLKDRADAVATRDMESAAAMVEMYAGPYASDLREQRASLAQAYRRQAEGRRSEEKELAAKVSGGRASYGAALAAANAAIRDGNWSRATGVWHKASADLGAIAAGLPHDAARDIAALQGQAHRWLADIEAASRMDSAAEAEYLKRWVGRKVLHRGVEGIVQDVEQNKLIVRVGKADIEMPVPPSDARTRLELAMQSATSGPDQLRARLLAAYVCGKREVAREAYAEILKNGGEAERFAALLADMDAMAEGDAREAAQKRVDAALQKAESMAAAEDEAAFENVIRQLEQSCAGSAAFSNALPRIDVMRNRAKARAVGVRQWKTFSGNSFNSLRSAVCGPVQPFVRWTRTYPRGAACPVAGSDGTVYVRSWNSVAALSPADGVEKWRCVIGGDGNLRSSLAVGNNDVVYVASGSKIHAVSPAGRLRWTRQFAASSPEWQGRTYLCIGEDDSLYCCGRMGNGNMALVKFTAEGDVVWECDTGARPPFLHPESLAVHRNGNAELSLDAVFMSVGADGKVRWDGRKAPHLRTVAIRPDGTTLRCGVRGQLFTFDGIAEKASRDHSFGKAVAGRIACYADGSVCVASVPDRGQAGQVRLAVWSPYGELKWEYSGPQAWGGAAALLIDNRNVLYALLCGGAAAGEPTDSKSALMVFSPDGQKQSEHQVPAGVARDVPALSMGGDGVLYVGGFQGNGVTAIGDMAPRRSGARSRP